jgi:membrane fusion protein, macrolide-specific efflux system
VRTAPSGTADQHVDNCCRRLTSDSRGDHVPQRHRSKKTKVVNGVLALGVAGIGFGGWKAVHSAPKKVSTSSTIVEAKKGIVLVSVTGTGNIVAPGQTDVSFDSASAANQVTEILVKTGDQVKKGQPLARVSATTLKTALDTATAQLALAQANYDKVQGGISAADRASLDAQTLQSKNGVSTAQTAYDNAVTTASQNVGLTAEAVEQAYDNLTNAKAQAERDIANGQSQVDQAEAALEAATTAKGVAQTLYDAGPTVPNTDALAKAQNTWTAASNAVTTTSNNFESTKLKAAQSVSTSNNQLTTANNNRSNGTVKDRQAIDSAARQLESAKASYNATVAANQVKLAGATAADSAQQELALSNANNQLATAQKNFDNATLVAPIDGTVASLTGKVGVNAGTGSSSSGAGGAAATASSAFLTITDLVNLEVKSTFSEADANKLKVGQGVTVTLDAITGTTLTGKIRQVDLAPVTANNVVSYPVYVTLDPVPPAAPVRPGMTASLAVTVQKADGVVLLPTTAVSSRGTSATVQVMKGTDPKVTEAVQVTIGLRGDTEIEITNGLTAGDKVVVTRQAATATATRGATAGSGTLTGGTTGGNTGVPGGAVPGAGTGGGRGGG